MFSKYSFNWLNLLEKEYDREFVVINEIMQDDLDDHETYPAIKKGLYSMVNIWSQLCHKVQTVFHTNKRLEENMAEMKNKLVESEATIKTLEKQLQSALLELQLLKLKDASANPKQIKAIENELLDFGKRNQVEYENALNEAEMKQLEAENAKLEKLVVNLQSEVFGNRLITCYLERELSGRVQQLQISNRNFNCKDYDRLWKQIESEIQLNRHKTLIKATKGPFSNNEVADCPSSTPRIVRLVRNDQKQFGFSISGGIEYSLPIIVSEVLKDSSAYNVLFVGDIISKVNGNDVSKVSISDFAGLLENIGDALDMEVCFINYEKRDIATVHADSTFEYPFVVSGAGTSNATDSTHEC